MAVATPVSTIDEQRADQMAGSAAMYQRAAKVFPGGVTHDTRYFEPFPLYITHAQGSRKWDLDGNEYVDYRGGHGALLLGHSHPAIASAVIEQAQKGTQYGSCNEVEVRWGELVQEIVPSAEKVKFVSSGTEATMMAMRLVRAFTGKDRIVKMYGHFHGWHDYATLQMAPPYNEPVSRGVPEAAQGTVLGVPPGDIAALRSVLDEHDDVAGVILLAGGLGTEDLQQVRDLTRERGIILTFDEVVTGFRYAPGGCQEFYGVTPDLTCLAKILAGGYPGGAVVGRADILAMFDHRPEDEQWTRFGRIHHPGTFNANPLCASAGVACLQIVRDGTVQKRATATAARIRAGVNAVLQRRGIAGQAGGEVSAVDISLPQAKLAGPRFGFLAGAAMQLSGVDTGTGFGMIVSAVHDDRDVELTVEAFDQALDRLHAEGAI